MIDPWEVFEDEPLLRTVRLHFLGHEPRISVGRKVVTYDWRLPTREQWVDAHYAVYGLDATIKLQKDRGKRSKDSVPSCFYNLASYGHPDAHTGLRVMTSWICGKLGKHGPFVDKTMWLQEVGVKTTRSRDEMAKMILDGFRAFNPEDNQRELLEHLESGITAPRLKDFETS